MYHLRILGMLGNTMLCARCRSLFDSRELTVAVSMEYIQSLAKAGQYVDP